MQESHFERLTGCFEIVFPNLSRSAIPAATHDSVAEWDSVAQVTLLSLVAEAFGIDIDFEEFEGSTSFAAILEFVNARTANAQS
jgi:acyl carrier protein